MSRAVELKRVRNIVILRTDRIGEVLLSTPVIEALRKKFPGAGIGFVVSPLARDIISDRPDISRVITFDTISKPPLLKAFQLSWELQKSSFDMAIVLNPHKVLHLGVFLAGIRYRVGFNRKWGFLLNIKTKDERDKAMMHEVKYNLRVLEAIGIREKSALPYAHVLAKSLYYVKGLFEKERITGEKKIIAIHPGTSNPAKRYPAEKFKFAAKRLAEECDADIIVIGSREERQLCGRISEGIKNAHDISGALTLRDLPAFFKMINLLITNDNGPMHIAAASGAKILALFNKDAVGSGPLRWGPYGEGHTVLHKSFSDITADEIVREAKKML
jgi:heptosyltransferase III